MSADTLSVYRHSGKFTVQGLALTLGAAAVAAFPLGLVYSYLIKWVPFIYLNLLATCGYGFVLGWVTVRMLKLGQVRNTPLAIACGLAAGVIGVYFEWSGHVHALVKNPTWVFTPEQIWRVMHVLYEKGTWGLRSGGPVTGIPLAIVWVIEAGIIIGLAVVLAYGFIATTPFCEKSKSWLDEETKFDTMELFTDTAQIAALGTGSVQPLLDAKPRPSGSMSWARLILKRSPRGQHFSTLRVQNVFIEVDGKGNSSEKTVDLTSDLIIPAEMFELIAQFARFDAPAAPPPTEPPAAAPSAG